MVARSFPSPSNSELIERALQAAVDDAGDGPPLLRQAIAHAVFPGGARVRPRLCLAIVEAWGGSREAAAEVGAAVELLHCASLVHDDLPCFDDADTRRGRPSVHKAHGEAMAVLVGDALIVAAFAQIARAFAGSAALGEAVEVLAGAAGAVRGLVAGQAWELEPGGPPELATYHRAKTAALFEAAAALAALSVGLPADRFVALGTAVGVAYQIADDLGDACASAEQLGKPVGRDAALGRPTAAAAGTEIALARFHRAVAQARAAVPPGRGAAAVGAFVERAFSALAERVGAA